jgi:hypothetical protein
MNMKNYLMTMAPAPNHAKSTAIWLWLTYSNKPVSRAGAKSNEARAADSNAMEKARDLGTW